MVVQSTSPMFARDSFWCIADTIKEADLLTYPYHVYVPSANGDLFLPGGTNLFTSRRCLLVSASSTSRTCPRFFNFHPIWVSAI